MPRPEPLPPTRAGFLRKAAGRVAAAEAELAEARRCLDGEIAYAVQRGYNVTEVAAAAGVSRETAYKSANRHGEWVAPRLA